MSALKERRLSQFVYASTLATQLRLSVSRKEGESNSQTRRPLRFELSCVASCRPSGSGSLRCRTPTPEGRPPGFKPGCRAAGEATVPRKQEDTIPTARAARWLATRSEPRSVLLPCCVEPRADGGNRTHTLLIRSQVLAPSSCVRLSARVGAEGFELSEPKQLVYSQSRLSNDGAHPCPVVNIHDDRSRDRRRRPEGIEPSRAGLEAAVLPLDHRPRDEAQ